VTWAKHSIITASESAVSLERHSKLQSHQDTLSCGLLHLQLKPIRSMLVTVQTFCGPQASTIYTFFVSFSSAQRNATQ
jgi:hypothetical protein